MSATYASLVQDNIEAASAAVACLVEQFKGNTDEGPAKQLEEKEADDVEDEEDAISIMFSSLLFLFSSLSLPFPTVSFKCYPLKQPLLALWFTGLA